MADLSQAAASSLGRYKQVWAFSTDEMNAREQQVLVDYARDGGQLVIFPHLPDREMNQQPCTVLRDSIPIHPSGYEIIDSPLIDLFDLKDIKCANPQVIYNEAELTKAEIITRTIRGNACGFRKSLGKGEVVHLGTWLGFDTEGHKPAYEALLKLSGARLRNAKSSNGFVNARERFTEDGKGMLFIGNYYNEEQYARVTYAHPASGDEISIPYAGEQILWPSLYAVLSPLCLEISEGLRILHATSDILEVKIKDGSIEITLYGDRDLKGEMVLEGENVAQITSVALDGVTVKMVRDGDRVILDYHHGHRKQMVFKIVL